MPAQSRRLRHLERCCPPAGRPATLRPASDADFANAGGLPVVTAELLRGGLLHGDLPTITGDSVAANVAGARCWRPEVIRTLGEPLQPAGSATAVLTGNLCPGGAVFKVSAASRSLLSHRGRALVFDWIKEYNQAAESPDMDVTAEDILVLRYAGPRGYPGMPEVGNLPLPRKLLAAGVSDMVRIPTSRDVGDRLRHGRASRRSGSRRIGGPLAALRTGDEITLDVTARLLGSRSTTRPSPAGARVDPPGTCGKARMGGAVCQPRPTGRHGLRSRLPYRVLRPGGTEGGHSRHRWTTGVPWQ